MYKELVRDKKGVLVKGKNKVSLYNPGEKGKTVTKLVSDDWQRGELIQNQARPEFNDRSVIQETDLNQRSYNSYIPARSMDPDESWRAQTVRPITRNKLNSIAAHVTEPILYPSVFAQNSNDEEDKDSAEAMRDLIEYVIDNSNYVRTFVRAVIAALVDPAVFLGVEYFEVMRKIREKVEDGTWKEKEVLDDILSGFKIDLIPCREILIANIFEPDIQKQRFVIRSKYIDHKEAQQIYGHHANWVYVQPGVRMVFDDASSSFYEVVDEQMKGILDNEVTYWNRYYDLKLCFVNGILVSDPEQSNTRIDKLYPIAKGGYEPIGNGQFFYYKSAANKLGSDQEIVDTIYNMIIDGTFMSLMPPVALYGTEDVNSQVMIPGKVTSFKDPNAKLENIGPRSDIRGGLQVASEIERSMSESSQDSSQGGNAQTGTRTAREVLLLQENARKALGLFGKSIRFLVEDTGNLIKGDILQFMTVSQVEQLTDVAKFRTFILSDKMVDGKKVSKKLKFVDPVDSKTEYSSKELSDKQFELLEKEGGLEAGERIYEIYPAFRNNTYKIKVSVDDLTPPSKAIEKALSLEAYDRAIQNPLLDQEAIARDFLLDVYRPGESDKYLAKNTGGPSVPEVPSPDGGANPLTNGGIQQKGVNTSMLSQITGSNSLGVAASSGQ